MGRARCLSLAAVLAAVSATSGAPAAELPDLSYFDTTDLRLLYFDPVQTYLVPHVARSFHNSLDFQRKVFDWDPYDPETTVLLQDFSDYGNAAARASPNNALMVDVAPLSRTFETFTASERMFTLMNHELAHVAQMDAWGERERRWRRFFGGKVAPQQQHPFSILYSYLTTPRTAVPRWYLEGGAVFMETWMAGGLGRAQGAYDEMVFRSMVRDGAHFYDPLGLVSEGTRIDFQVGVNAYLYGTRFMCYLGLVYSPEQVVEWQKRGPGSERYYAKQFEHVFGKPLEVAWQDWIEWEHGFQENNLASIRQHPLTPYESLSSHPLGSISRTYIDVGTHTIYGAFRYPGVVAHVGALDLDRGTVARLEDIKGPMLYRVSSLTYDPDHRTVFYTTDNYTFRDVRAIDVDTGESRMLLENARIGDLAFNRADRSIWGIRHLNGIASLVRIPYPYEEWSQIYSWPYGTILYDLDISQDGRLLSTSMGEVNGDQFLRVFDIETLMAGDATAIGQVDFGLAVPEGFVFSPDGRYLYGSSYYTGVSNIFRYELATDEIEAVSNAETGFFRPMPLPDGNLVVFNYTGQGFVPVVIEPVPLEDLGAITFLGQKIAEEHPVVRGWQVGSLTDVPLDDLTVSEGIYKPNRNLGLQNAYPVIEGYKDSVALGYHFNIEDGLGFSSLAITGSVGLDDNLPDNERVHIDIDYSYRYWHLRYSLNHADFYDLFGPIKRSRKGRVYAVGYERALVYDRPRRLDVKADVAYFEGLERLPTAQNIPVNVSQFTQLGVNFDYQNTRGSLGKVDDEKGMRWDAFGGTTFAQGESIPKIRGSFDFGFALPLRHSSIWLRNATGWANGRLDDVFANYYFGAFGNNYVDFREVKRYRQYYSLPGFGIDEISAQTFYRGMLEWNLPPVIFEKVGRPSAYLSWLRPAIFATALIANPENSNAAVCDPTQPPFFGCRRTVQNIGAQIDLEFTVVHRLPMTVSLGYAVGYEGGARVSDEWMLSLKIM